MRIRLARKSSSTPRCIVAICSSDTTLLEPDICSYMWTSSPGALCHLHVHLNNLFASWGVVAVESHHDRCESDKRNVHSKFLREPKDVVAPLFHQSYRLCAKWLGGPTQTITAMGVSPLGKGCLMRTLSRSSVHRPLHFLAPPLEVADLSFLLRDFALQVLTIRFECRYLFPESGVVGVESFDLVLRLRCGATKGVQLPCARSVNRCNALDPTGSISPPTDGTKLAFVISQTREHHLVLLAKHRTASHMRPPSKEDIPHKRCHPVPHRLLKHFGLARQANLQCCGWISCIVVQLRTAPHKLENTFSCRTATNKRATSSACGTPGGRRIQLSSRFRQASHALSGVSGR